MAIEYLCAIRGFDIPYSDGAVSRPRDKDCVEILQRPDSPVVAVEGMCQSSRAGLVDVDGTIIRAGNNPFGIKLETSHDIPPMALERNVTWSCIRSHPVTPHNEILTV